MYHIFFIYSSVNGHLGCFHVLATVNTVTMNIGGYVSFCFLTIYFNWRLITLQYCSVFCHTLTWIGNGCTCAPHLEPPSHLPPYPIPQGHPSAPALSTLSHASNLYWRSVSHMICFNAILSNHPTLTFSHRVRKTVLYISVSFAVSHIGSSLPSF